MNCKCGLGHRGWEQPQACNIELARRAREPLPVTPEPVTVTAKVPKSVTVTPKAVEQAVTVTRMAALRKRKAEAGLVAMTIWARQADHAAIKAYAKSIQK